MGSTSAVVFIPPHAVHIVAATIFLVPSCPASIFPLSFARQTILFPGLGIQFPDIFLRVIPAYTLRWTVAAAVTGEKATKVAWIVAHDGSPLPLRHFSLAHCECFSDGDTVYWRFLLSARTHVETTCR